MKYLERQRYGKLVKHLQREARHARNMREDVAPPQQLDALTAAEQLLREAWQARDPGRLDAAAEQASTAIAALYPPRRLPRLRENLEILVVALAIAMAFRTFFIQPFKIPTGSMQPTLYGITVQPQETRQWSDYFPFNLIKLAVFGERFTEIKAKITGRVNPYYERVDHNFIVYVDGVPHEIHSQMAMYFKLGDYVQKGQRLASGLRRIGDHIFVNKVLYNFARPQRGDIIVFDTAGIQHPAIKTNTFYIKRLVGLPNERIAVDPPYLLVNTQRVTEPYPFERLLTATNQGYNGYALAQAHGQGPRPKLADKADVLILGDQDYLPFGDNTHFSLDGRYFGPIEETHLVGPAFAVYWPFGKRWGWVQ